MTLACVLTKYFVIFSMLALHAFLFKSYKTTFLSFQETSEKYTKMIEGSDDEAKNETIVEEITEANEVRKAKEQQVCVKVVPVQ